MDDAIHWISVDKTNHAIHWIVIYPLNSILHPANNLGKPGHQLIEKGCKVILFLPCSVIYEQTFYACTVHVLYVCLLVNDGARALDVIFSDPMS